MSERAERDVNQVVRYLVATFNKATSGMERPAARKKGVPNPLYKAQTEFAYLLNEVTQGPASIMQYNIAQCNAYIDTVLMSMNNESN
jgi:hypothetical protein